MSEESFEIGERRVLIEMTAPMCGSPQQMMRSPSVARVVEAFLRELGKRDSPLLAVAEQAGAAHGEDGSLAVSAQRIADALRLLADAPYAKVAEMVPGLAPVLADRRLLAEFVERLYDFWRTRERYLIFEARAESSRDRALEGHASFISAHEQVRDVVLETYRRVEANLRGHWPRVYRQVPAGTNMSLLVETIPWPCPGGLYQPLRDIRMVRLALLEPPLVVYSRRNSRRERFAEADANPLVGLELDPAEWFCMPLKVGPLVIFVFFHEEYLALGASLVNLFELAGHADARRKPDAVLVFGVPREPLGDRHALFYEDAESDIVVGVVGRTEDVDYFGYFEKATLTLHNLAMMRRGRLPVHGSIWRVELAPGGAATLLIVGDIESGKGECLEAFRVLADRQLRRHTIIADDMGSLEVAPDGTVRAYGTGIGAFVRLDALEQGFASGQMDRSITMNPHRSNARLVIPVTTFEETTAGYPLDAVLYANNYDQVDESHPALERFTDVDRALHVFGAGAMLAKGTTISTGIVHRYFANPFGPQFRRALHDELARRTFEAAFRAGVFVGQVRTRLGIARYAESGPRVAAQALLELLRERSGAVESRR